MRGKQGGEKSEFKVGGIAGRYPDSLNPEVTTGVITLTQAWQRIEIDLRGKKLTHVVGGFCWVSSIVQNPSGATIYLDDAEVDKLDSSATTGTGC